MTNDHAITESTLHYAVGLLARYADQYQTKKHGMALAELRKLSDDLLDYHGPTFLITVFPSRKK